MRALRPELARAAPEAGAQAAAAAPVAALAALGVVAGYRPIQDEIDPTPLLAALEAAGTRVALSVTRPKGDERPMTFRAWPVGSELVKGAFGTREPPETAEEVTPALIVAPLVAFDPDGFRLGYGKGHFDRTIAPLRAAGGVLVLGLAYAGQEVARCLAEPHDQRLDAVLTERGYRGFSPAGVALELAAA